MIFNWEANCERILNTHEYSMRDKWEKKMCARQQIVLMRYLTDKGWPKEDIRKLWDQIPNPTLDQCAFEDKDIVFNKIFLLSTRCGLVKSTKRSKIFFYQDEIDYLNNLDCPRWLRIYFAGLTTLWKSRFPKVRLTQYINNYIMTYTGKTTYENCEEPILATNRRLDFFRIKYLQCTDTPHAGLPTRSRYFKYIRVMPEVFTPIEDTKKGTPILVIDSMEDFGQVVELISERQKKCSQCDKPYDCSEHKKNTLCPECQKKNRRAYKTAYMAKTRAKAKNNEK